MNPHCPECGRHGPPQDDLLIFECPQCGAFYPTVEVTQATLPGTSEDSQTLDRAAGMKDEAQVGGRLSRRQFFRSLGVTLGVASLARPQTVLRHEIPAARACQQCAGVRRNEKVY